jgi:hypothetical protein
VEIGVTKFQDWWAENYHYIKVHFYNNSLSDYNNENSWLAAKATYELLGGEMPKFTTTLIKQCFPHKEAIMFNLDIAVEIASSNECIADEERVRLLCQCRRHLESGNVGDAVEAARSAGYNLMAEAIKFHFAGA